ncbi:helix-turn-helix domain-containing protein [Geodermatophilus sp. SYSU D00708]
MDVDLDELLNVRETARRLGVHENTVRNWARQGLLPEARVPGSRFHRFRATDVERLIAQRGSAAPSLQSERRAVNPELVSANQLKQWPVARGRDAQETFPELVRRLLVETPGISNISIRSGDGVALQGWDGLAESTGTAFLPAGHLGLEFGVDQNPRAKANHDYNNRVSDTPSSKVFVFITPRRWAEGPAWANERRAEGHFADVRVLDGDDLEGWLRATPGAHHWISEHLGLRPRDAKTIDAWWDRFSASTDPVLPAALFLAGRSAQAEQLVNRLADRPQLTVVQSESRRDVLGFVYASLYARGDDAAPVELPTIVVSAVEVWDRILEQPGQAILIPQFDGADVGAALDKGHQVISIIDRTTVSRRAIDITLPRLDRRAAAEAFQTAGVDFSRADRLAVLGRRSLPALVRRLSRNPRFSRPSWASQPDADVLAPLVLAGAWTTSEEDAAAVATLTGQPWSVIDQTVRRVATSSDPVLRKVGRNWSFTSPEEAFLWLQDSLTTEAVERWCTEMRAVLLAPDPLLDLAPDARVTAQLQGVRRVYSGALRRGLAQGLALMGAMGATSTLDHGSTLADMATLTIRQLLDEANRDSSGRAWHQLAHVLPLLAEAAPDTFLAAVDDGLAGSEPVLLQLFQEDDAERLFGQSSPHPHLLWALETVCWAEQYLIDGVRALARLAAVEPGGKSGNRPSASLAAILCGWVRNTSASLEVRLQGVDAAYDVSETVGWRLIFALWPSNHGWVMPPAAPRIRDDWRPAASSVPMADWVTFVQALVDRAITHAGTDPSRVIDLVEGLSTVSPADRDRIIDFLQSQATSSLDDDGRLQLWETLQALVARHERFSTAAWAMPADVRTRLTELVSALEPQADPQRFAYLFEWHPDLPGIEGTDYERYSNALWELRQQAIRSVLDGPDAFNHFRLMAQRVKAPSQLGMALAEHDDVNFDEMRAWLDADNPALREAAANWARHRMARSGPEWIAEALQHPALTGSARQTILRTVPASSDFWQVLHDSSAPSDETDYWSAAPIDFVPLPDTSTALAQLIGHGRAWSAIAVAAHALEQGRRVDDAEGAAPPLDHAAVIALLNQAEQQEPNEGEISQMTGYYVGQLLDHLTATDAPVGDIARFEFAFFRLLEHHREPAVLNRALASQPEIFVDLVKRAYRAKDQPRREPADAEAEENLATQAWWVLNGWTGFPGREEDGSLNPTTMTEWVRVARLELSEANRADIGDELIGQTFAHSPQGADGIWPAEPVRDLVETIGSPELESGVLIGRLNSRGVTSRGAYDGGQQERALAAQYRDWTATVRARWPRTARILRDIASSYDRDAHREDVRAELNADQD